MIKKLKEQTKHYVRVYRKAINGPTHSPKDVLVVVATLLLLIGEVYVLYLLQQNKEVYNYSVSAATLSNLETENSTLGGNYAIINDPEASGGKLVVFGVPGNSPTPASSLVISNPRATNVTNSGATIKWELSDFAKGYVDYGTTTSYGSKSKIENSFGYDYHIQSLKSLKSGTTYHYRITSEDANGNIASSGDCTFTTGGSSTQNCSSSGIASAPTNAPTPTPTPEPCTLTSAKWQTITNPVNSDDVIALQVVGSATCAGQQLSFNVRENDSIAEGGLDDDAIIKPANAIFNASGQATTTWVAEWQNDCGGLCNPPEYFFNASLVSNSGTSIRSSDPLLQVTQAGGTPTLVVSNPRASGITNSSATISWELNDFASGQVEYGTTTNYGQKSKLQTCCTYDHHAQTISGLSNGTTYHYRVVSTDSDGNTATSGNCTFTTGGASAVDCSESSTNPSSSGPTNTPQPTSPPSSGGVGPRPDPAFPTGSNVVTVDSTVPTNGSDAKPALQAFIDKQPNGTTIIFDKTKGGAGTTYNLNSRINLITKKDITLWGYNSKLKLTREDGSTEGAGILVRNGSENIKILGFEIEGPNYTNDLHDLYDMLPGEWSHGIYIMISRNVTIQDNHIHHVNGDAVYGLARGPSSTSWNDGSKGWTYQGPFEISYNYFHHTGRQGIANMSGIKLNIHHNLFEDIVAWPVDLEDHGEESFVFDELYITDNIMRRFNWWVRYNCHSTSILYAPSKKFDWSRNLIDEGCMGIGNADVPISVYEKYGKSNLYPRPGHRWIQIRTRHPILKHTNEVVIQNNRVTVGSNNTQGTRTDEGALALENSSDVLTITGNQFEPEARIILIGDTIIENISNNGDARVQYEWYP